jgi:hypothetical protein
MKTAVMIITILLAVGVPAGGAIYLELQENKADEEVVDDTTPPTSSISSPRYLLIPSLYDIGTPSFTVEWEGEDDPEGSGVRHFDVQYACWPYGPYEVLEDRTSLPPGGWKDLAVNTTRTSAVISVLHESYFTFRIRATDNSGNIEEWPRIGETRTLVISIPYRVYNAIITGREISEELKENIQQRVPADTPPVSRVLPLPPLALPEPLLKGDRIRVVMYPDIDLSATLSDQFIFRWAYGSIDVKWEGMDPKGTDDLRYDVQFRMLYLEDDLVYIPEAPFKFPFLPEITEWTDWLSNTSSEHGYFNFRGGGLHEFRCRASDSLGNVEDYPLTADAFTYVLPMF